jgi:dTDP-4-amino-4,6-dideoxygalactose transaminase
MKPYSDLYPHAGLLLENTSKVADRVVVLPTGTTMDEEMVRMVVRILRILLNG